MVIADWLSIDKEPMRKLSDHFEKETRERLARVSKKNKQNDR